MSAMIYLITLKPRIETHDHPLYSSRHIFSPASGLRHRRIARSIGSGQGRRRESRSR